MKRVATPLTKSPNQGLSGERHVALIIIHR
ncbi:MAG: hypothetical protein ETSY2_51850 [Candidatus Entotheonella gemina]|uniref:Uncharacterized protein n=1 Tax=Candidatus Entotheonella gemina TaxID=1429439 RepID=W4L5P1_9BACT|nr:MAG: hypothetical protein ETSY2_51850 [Candidatus Entotheonella gemina]